MKKRDSEAASPPPPPPPSSPSSSPSTPSAAADVAWLALAATSLKLLLFASYRSTDFEVHRHWMALTYSLPMNQWYVDESSEWTLDYPPLFAFFERCLASLAALVDPSMLHLTHGAPYASPATVIFQRLTVVATDFLLVLATYLNTFHLPRAPRLFVSCAILFCPGLFMVDHIHFQYNGWLLALLLLATAAVRASRFYAAALLFSLLCCSKHLFAVAGPWFLLFLLCRLCLSPPLRLSSFLFHLSLLAASVAALLAASFGPFILMGQLLQLLSRLFPFGRGLCHAYWAPNLWALYNLTDKILCRLLGASDQSASAAMTGGLVGNQSHELLPQITPLTSLMLVLLSMGPLLVHVCRHPSLHQRLAARSLSLVFFCSFMLGWHVHEKAALHFLLPLALSAADSRQRASRFITLSCIVHYSLFPLLFEPEEYAIKLLLLLVYVLFLHAVLPAVIPEKACNDEKLPTLLEFFNRAAKPYLVGMVALELFNSGLHPLMFNGRLPFLPLLLTSTYTAVGLVAVWMIEYFLLLHERT